MPVVVPHVTRAGRLTVLVVVLVSAVVAALLTVWLIRESRTQGSRCAVTRQLASTCGKLWGSAVDQNGETLVTAVRRSEKSTGRRLDVVHTYHRWSDVFPTSSEKVLASQGRTLFVNWQPTSADGGRIGWASIAAGRQDQQIDRVAHRLAALHRPLLLSFSHEPELDVGHSGSVADFANAWRHVHDRFAHDGVTNVRWVWTVIGLDQDVWLARYPQLWPGARYVDWIGWDPYNWASCRQRAWTDFAGVVHPFYDWLVAHMPKDVPLMLAEYGTVESAQDPNRKAQWYRDEIDQLGQFPRLRALVYFDLPHPPANCDWLSTTSTRSLAGFRALAHSGRFAA